MKHDRCPIGAPPAWVLVLAVAAAYLITARLGLLLALPPEGKATAIWPPSGIALAALVLAGNRAWPGIWLGALIANLWDGLAPGNQFPWFSHLLASSAIASGSTVQALAGNALVERWIPWRRPFQHAASAFTFAGIALLVTTLAATIGVGSLHAFGFVPASSLGFLWWTWWLGDATGVLLVGSLLLAWSQVPPGISRGRLVEALSMLALLTLGAAFIFGLLPNGIGPPPLAYLAIPMLVWATFRFGLHGATTSLLVVNALAVVATMQGTGPFLRADLPTSLLTLQIFMAVVSITVLVMAAVLNERSSAERRAHGWQSVFTHASWAVAIVDPEYDTLRAVNPAFAAMHGYTVAELIGRPMHDLLAAGHAGRISGHIDAADRTGVEVYDAVHARRDGSTFPCLTHLTTVRRLDGSVDYRAATFQDIGSIKDAEATVRESEGRLASLASAVPGFLFTSQADGRNEYVSGTFYDYTGMSEGAARGYGWMAAVHPEDRAGAATHFADSVREGRMFEYQYRFRAADGGYRWFLVRAVPMQGGPEGGALWSGICTDIDDRKRAEADLRNLNASLERRIEERTQAYRDSERELRVHEQRFRSAFDDAPIGVALVAPDGRWLRVNRSLCDMLGYTEDELLATDFQALTYPDDLHADLQHLRDMLAGTSASYQMEKRYFHKAGHLVHSLLSVSLVRDGAGAPLYFISQIQDITARKHSDAETQRSLREKDVLLKEIHHRVKNNLQIVSSLLDLQSGHTVDRQVLELFKQSRGRVKSMALIHERLYRSQDLTRVHFDEYIRQLAEELYGAYKVSDEQITLHVDVAAAPLAIDVAIPCGLLINELVSNCLKHAFAGRDAGWIAVSLAERGDEAVLTVADNGVGLPEPFDAESIPSFGMQLVQTLVEQLHGTIEFRNDHGCEAVVTFPMTGTGTDGLRDVAKQHSDR